MVIAQTFGAGAASDAFLVAFKIPNFMRRLFAEGAFSQAFIPVLSEYKTNHDEETNRQLVAHVSGSLGLILLILTIIGIVFSSWTISVFAPGFWQYPEKFALASDLLKITFPYLFFIALTALAGGVLNTYGNFAVPALTPVILNICMITAVLWFTNWTNPPIMGLAYGVFLAGLMQLLFQLPFLARYNMLVVPRFQWQHAGVQRIYKLMLPAIFGVSVTQINLLVDTIMASFLVTGSVSWLYYSDRLMEFPVGVFGLALSTVILPTLSKKAAKKEWDSYNHTLDWAVRWVFLIGAPATVGMIVLSAPILSTLFHYGEFDQHDLVMTQYSLNAYAFGLIAFVLAKVLASGFYARQDTKTPVKIAVICMLTNIGLNLILISFLQHAGLALSTSCAAIVNSVLLFYYLRKAEVFRPHAGWLKLLIQISFASLVMGLILWFTQNSLQNWLVLSTLMRGAWLCVWIILGMAAYALALLIAGWRWRDVSNHGDV